MMKFRKRFQGALVLSTVVFLVGFGKPEHSTVSTKATNNGDIVDVTVMVSADSDMQVTLDAPWKLTISNVSGANFGKSEFTKKDLDEKLPGFRLQSKVAADKKGSFDYKVISFICTKDKTRCYREVHKGKVTWPKDTP
jgi:hypothetical protein